MRRPVKPFVTEYRGATRRQPGSTGLGSSNELEAPPPRPAEPRQTETSRFVAAQQEDTYEAALRAADALFSGSRGSEPPMPFEPLSPKDTRAEASPERPAAAVVEGRPSGRVLRVIDEPPLQELALLEAERAPKRRGRKPGSKNKPKVPIAAITAESPAEAPAPARTFRRLPRSPEISPLPVAAIFTAPEPGLSDAVHEADAAQIAPYRVATQASRGEKYAWVRTKLKPGERWKRRLPKITW